MASRKKRNGTETVRGKQEEGRKEGRWEGVERGAGEKEEGKGMGRSEEGRRRGGRKGDGREWRGARGGKVEIVEWGGAGG